MTNTLTISISPQDLVYLNEKDENKKPKHPISPTILFREALFLYRRMDLLPEIYSITEFVTIILKMQKQISEMQEELFKKEDKIDSLKNVLEQTIIADRRVRKVESGDSGLRQESGALEDIRREFGEQLKESTGISEQKDK